MRVRAPANLASTGYILLCNSDLSGAFIRAGTSKIFQTRLDPLRCHHEKSASALAQKRGLRCLRCAAVALAVTPDSICEGDPSSDIFGATASSSGSQDVHRSRSRVRDNVPVSRHPTYDEGAVVGEIVLSDWLDELPLAPLSPPDSGQEDMRKRAAMARKRTAGTWQKKGRHRSNGPQSSIPEADSRSSAPFRFQLLIQKMWAELSRGDKLLYLGIEGEARVKGALTVLAAYCALREHPLQAGVDSPQQAFSEMDFNRDGEVSFDEFVRWYSMSSVLDTQPQHPSAEALGDQIHSVATPRATGELSSNFAVREQLPEDDSPLAPSGSANAASGASRLLADLETSLQLVEKPLASVRAPVYSSRASSASQERLTASMPLVDPATLAATETEKEAARERWLSGGSHVGDADVLEEVRPTGANVSAAEDLERALGLLRVLLKTNADADTLIAALAGCIIKNAVGRYNLEVIEEQFGPIIRGIVEERLLLERLPEPTSAQSRFAIRQSYGVKPVLDLDDHNAKHMRDYLVRLSRDCRAVVVHMADLTYRLREPDQIPTYARQSLALEALQLYVPVSNALGLGASFRELEELGYQALFPQTYSEMTLWHRDVKGKSRDIVKDVTRRMLDALHARDDIATRLRDCHVEGRTKDLVSTFRKVFRQNKRATDVHDILGFRIVVTPHSNSFLNSSASAAAAANIGSSMEAQMRSKHPSSHRRGSTSSGRASANSGWRRGKWSRNGGRLGPPREQKIRREGSRAVFTFKTFPPPYRDTDSQLLHDVYEILLELFQEIPGRYKNYVDFPKANGYRSVHTTVMHPSGLMMEFQMRTAKMHKDAEGGAAAHSLYKGSLENPAEASLFRSKMTLDTTQTSKHRLPSIAKRHRANPPVIDAHAVADVEKANTASRVRRWTEANASPAEAQGSESNRSREP